MQLTLYHIVLLILSYLIFKIASSLIARRRFKAFAEQRGCKPAYSISNSPVGGFKRLRRLLALKTSGEDLLDDIVAEDLSKSATVQFTTFDGNHGIETADPVNLQALLATQFKDFVTGSRRYNAFKPLIGRSIFSSDGPFWEHSRALFRPQFARENVNDLEVTDKACDSLIRVIGDADAAGWTESTEMLPLLYNFTLDTATDFLFGESIDSQEVAIAARYKRSGEIEEDAEKAARMEEAQRFKDSLGIINDTLLFRIQVQSFWWLGDGLQFRKALRYVRKYTERFVHLASQHNSSSPKSGSKKESLLHNLATQTHNERELRDQTLAILVAGRDTTASTLGWSLVRLALHPNVFNNLRSIVLKYFNGEDPITFEKLKSCRYLQHFLNEVLRLHPVVPVNQRLAARDTTLPVGGGPDQRSPVAIRKGKIILFSVYNMHRRKELWGADAEEFRPERWEEKVPAWQFLPFLGGPRVCLGQQFALTEAGYLLTRLLLEFDAIEPVDRAEMQKMKKGLGVTMWPGDGVKVRFRKAATPTQ